MKVVHVVLARAARDPEDAPEISPTRRVDRVDVAPRRLKKLEVGAPRLGEQDSHLSRGLLQLLADELVERSFGAADLAGPEKVQDSHGPTASAGGAARQFERPR